MALDQAPGGVDGGLDGGTAVVPNLPGAGGTSAMVAFASKRSTARPPGYRRYAPPIDTRPPGKRRELVERGEIPWILAQHLDVGLLGSFVFS